MRRLSDGTKKAAAGRGGRPRRRWPRRLIAGLVGLLVLIAGVYVWARASVDSSTTARALIWRDADVGDQFRFPARTIATSEATSALPNGREIHLPAVRREGGPTEFDTFLRRTGTLAFVVAHDDEIVYERYFGGADPEDRQTSFSVAKSFLSTLIGIAIDEGFIASVDDPVTDYIPELAERDPRFSRITLRHLLTMSSGLRYWETDLPWPWTDDTVTYYGADLRDAALSATAIEGPPGEEWHYNNYNPLLLGLVLERATGMSVSEFMSTRLWRPLGAEADATWNLDSEDSRFEKLESGLNATPRDYARLGLLFLHEGVWGGERIVPDSWIREATAADTEGDPAAHYQYYWWVDEARPGRYYALGNLGQFIYVAPDADAVLVRSGREWGLDSGTWLGLLRDVADRLVD